MFKSLKKYKKWIFLTLLLTFIIFILRFPWNKTVQKIASHFQTVLPISGDPENIKLLFFPPGIAFYKHSIDNPSFLSQYEMDAIKVLPAFSKLLALDPGVKVSVEKEKSSIAFTLWLKNKKIKEEEIKEIHIKGSSPEINLSLINTPENSLKASGKTTFRFELTLQENNLQKTKGSLSLTGTGIEIKNGLITTNLGPINLPDLKWSKVNLKTEMKEGELVIERLELGTNQDPLFIQMRGNMELNARGRRIQPSYYDFQTKIEVDANLKSNLITTIDLFLADTKTSIENGVRYLARIKGSGHKPPDIEKLLDF